MSYKLQNVEIKAAIESGELSLERWDSYLKIKREVKFTTDRSVLVRNKDARNKVNKMKDIKEGNCKYENE